MHLTRDLKELIDSNILNPANFHNLNHIKSSNHEDQLHSNKLSIINIETQGPHFKQIPMKLNDDTSWNWDKNFTKTHQKAKLPKLDYYYCYPVDHTNVTDICYTPETYDYYWIGPLRIVKEHRNRAIRLSPKPKHRSWAYSNIECDDDNKPPLIRNLPSLPEIKKLTSSLFQAQPITNFGQFKYAIHSQISHQPYTKFNPLVWEITGGLQLLPKDDTESHRTCSIKTYLTLHNDKDEPDVIFHGEANPPPTPLPPHRTDIVDHLPRINSLSSKRKIRRPN